MLIIQKQCSLDFKWGRHLPLPLSIPLSMWIKTKTGRGRAGSAIGRGSAPSPAAPAPQPRSAMSCPKAPRHNKVHFGSTPAPAQEDIGLFFALTTGSLRQGISHSCSSMIWMAFTSVVEKETHRNVPQRNGFQQCPCFLLLSCVPERAPSQVSAILLTSWCGEPLPLSLPSSVTGHETTGTLKLVSCVGF